MAATITPNLTIVDDCDANTDWDPVPDEDIEIFIQGIGSVSEKVSKSTYASQYPLGSATDLSDTVIYVWVLGSSIAQFNTKALGGISIQVYDGTNTGRWYVAGDDEGYEGGWQCLAVRTTQTLDYEDPGSVVLASGTHVGVYFNIDGSAAKNNLWWDIERYGTGLTVTSGTVDNAGIWDDLVTADANVSNKYGIVSEFHGVIFVQGQIVFGDTDSTDTYFSDTSRQIVFMERAFGDDFYKIDIVGGTGTTNFILGEKAGTQGVNGCNISTAARDWSFDATETDINGLALYGCVFNGASSFKLPTSAISGEVLNCSWINCGEVDPDTFHIKYCNVISAPNNGMLFDAEDAHDITDSAFISCSGAIRITASGAYDFNNLTFAGNTYDINNDSGGTVNINLLGTSDAASYTGSTVNFIKAVSLTVSVEDTDGAAISGASCYIEKTSDHTQLMNELTTVAGIAVESFDYGAGPAVPITVRIRKSSLGSTRYVPYNTTGTITSDGYTLTAVMTVDENIA